MRPGRYHAGRAGLLSPPRDPGRPRRLRGRPGVRRAEDPAPPARTLARTGGVNHGFKNLQEFMTALEVAGELRRIRKRSPHPGDHRDRGPHDEAPGRRPGPALRTGCGLAFPSSSTPLAAISGWPWPWAPRRMRWRSGCGRSWSSTARDDARKAGLIPKALSWTRFFPRTYGKKRPPARRSSTPERMWTSRPCRSFTAGPGRGTLRHPAGRLHQEPQGRPPERRDVPPADLR